MKSIDTHIKLINEIKSHPKLSDAIKSRLSTYNSFLSADFIVHYGEVINCLCLCYDSTYIDIGVGYVFDKTRSYAVFRICSAEGSFICDSVDSVVTKLTELVSFDLMNDQSVYDTKLKNKSVIKDTQIDIGNPYDYGNYTTYIRKLIADCLPAHSTGHYYNRRTGDTRRLEFLSIKLSSVPLELRALANKLSNQIRPYIHRKGYLVVEFKNEE